jgi:predicted AAA+ superfamily ATPase
VAAQCFPDSFPATNDRASLRWRQDFIRTYLERDIPQLGPRIPAETLRRFWTMLAHHQTGLLKAAHLARSLGVDGKTVASYLDLLLVRRLQPWHANAGKRLLGHPLAGASWEGFVVETMIAAAPQDTEAHFYRTSAGAEIDLLLTPPGGRPLAIEIKRGLTPKLEEGFYLACEDLQPEKQIVIYPGRETYPLKNDVSAMSLSAAGRLLREWADLQPPLLSLQGKSVPPASRFTASERHDRIGIETLSRKR